MKLIIPGLLPTLNVNSCGVAEYSPLYNVLQPVPCVIGMISMSISNAQRIVGVTVGVGVAVGSIDIVGVIVGVKVGVLVTVGLGVRVILGVGVFVGLTVDVIVGDGVTVAVTVIVGDGVGVINVSQSIITSLANVLLVQGESNLIEMFFVPTDSYDLNAL